jgi:predicted proteasome-type protease
MIKLQYVIGYNIKEVQQHSPVSRVVVTANDAFTSRLIVGGARMSGECLTLFVSFPNVQLGAAVAVISFARVGVTGNGFPVL